MNEIQSTIGKLVRNEGLSKEESEAVMRRIMSGEATQAQIGSFLTALRMKGESLEEITSFAKIMREFASRIKPKVDGPLVDTCGTGGDLIKTFNISTAAMFVAAGAGIYIAKHGNRSVTSKAGSADVLEALGIKVDMSPEEVERTIKQVGIGFMFAPRFHPAMKYAIGPRREIKIRTVFNILGPLTNPAGAQAQLMGVHDGSMTEKLARVLGNLGTARAMVVYGVDGLDEISTLGPTKISELYKGEVKTYTITPGDFGISRTSPEEIAGKDAEENAKILIKILKGQRGPRRDIVVLNSAAAIAVGGKAKSIGEGIPLAENAIDSGKAYEKLVQFVGATGGMRKLRSLEGMT
jgi:anthranilate phosphoribosyltransferase